ncbi:hypothetical protein [Exiguobacterium sp. s5]|uniref:hypothetical protein n=1 Tax=Exiguobacterium sp. s5 TaxID=2751239 RepID=UPI001BE856F4|nr:hypothetical protein [Exiguobacterium sp. s5]
MKKVFIVMFCSVLFLSGCAEKQVSGTYDEEEREVVEIGETTFDYKLSKFEYDKTENKLIVEYETGLPDGTAVSIFLNPHFPNDLGKEYNLYSEYMNQLRKEVETESYKGKIFYEFTDDEFDSYKLPKAEYYLILNVPMSESKNTNFYKQIKTEEKFLEIYPAGKIETESSYYSFYNRGSENQIFFYDEGVKLDNGYTLKEINESYSVLPYKEISKNAEKFNGQHAQFTGEVMEIKESENEDLKYETYLRIDVGNNEVIYIDYVSSSGMEDVFEGDNITVQGKMTGDKTYESIAGHTITIPSMEAITYFK